MKSNDEIISEFEARRNYTLKECKEHIKTQCLNENEETQIMEVDNIFEYMKSLGYSTIDEIKEKYSL